VTRRSSSPPGPVCTSTPGSSWFSGTPSGRRPFGKWAAFEVALVVPRQQGKGSVLEALELAALFLADPDAPPPLILHSAHEFKTSAEHFRRVRDLVEGTSFAKQVRIIRTAAGAEAIELHSGARLRFVTRSGGSGRGFSADLVVIDEAYNLTAESMAAVLPTMAARPNPQIWYTSSAGMVASEQLAHIRERGSRRRPVAGLLRVVGSGRFGPGRPRGVGAGEPVARLPRA
jgi:hypothetical protein